MVCNSTVFELMNLENHYILLPSSQDRSTGGGGGGSFSMSTTRQTPPPHISNLASRFNQQFSVDIRFRLGFTQKQLKRLNPLLLKKQKIRSYCSWEVQWEKTLTMLCALINASSVANRADSQISAALLHAFLLTLGSGLPEELTHKIHT